MKIESYQAMEEKKRWKVVRRYDCADVEGDVVAADEETGECSIFINGETKSMSFGSGGIRIVPRAR